MYLTFVVLEILATDIKRIFSIIKILKNYIQNSLGQNYLTGLVLLSACTVKLKSIQMTSSSDSQKKKRQLYFVLKYHIIWYYI